MSSNPQLNDEQLELANDLLGGIRSRIEKLADGDEALVFAYRRKVYKELSYDERGKPGHRKRLKKKLRKTQGDKCADCGGALPERGGVLDRREAIRGYTEENCDVICPACDHARQAANNFR